MRLREAAVPSISLPLVSDAATYPVRQLRFPTAIAIADQGLHFPHPGGMTTALGLLRPSAAPFQKKALPSLLV